MWRSSMRAHRTHLALRVSAYLKFIAANTRRLRHNRGLTQEDLARRAKLDHRFLQRIEAASTNISITSLVALAQALGVSPTTLLVRATFVPAPRGRPAKLAALPARASTPATSASARARGAAWVGKSTRASSRRPR